MVDPEDSPPDPDPSLADEEGWIDMRLSRVIVRDEGQQQWIYLSEVDGKRGFPIVIGGPEAQEIQRVVTGVQVERPLTHQLTMASIHALRADLTRIDIVDLRNNTFHAQLVLTDAENTEHLIDARPSDAVCLGLRAGCGIRVAESVLEQVRTDTSGPDPLPPEDPLSPEPPLSPEDSSQNPEFQDPEDDDPIADAESDLDD